MRVFFLLLLALFFLPSLANAQQNVAEEAMRRAETLRILPEGAAKRLFFLKIAPARLKPASIGAYGKGCLAGGKRLEADGPGWQAMRLSRERAFGHPKLIAFIKKLAAAAQKDGWPGLLIGDMGQARGGPMLTGHASHQLGLEADIWLTPAPPDRILTLVEREENSAVDMVQPDLLNVWPERFTDAHARLLRRAAQMPEVDRIFVNPAIKKAACAMAKVERKWLRKLRPWQGHTYHFHVALKCRDNTCVNRRAAIPPGDGCGKALSRWFLESARFPKPKPPVPEKILTLKDLPKKCAAVLASP